MGKLLDSLNKQLKIEEYRQDAEDCLLIYNKLKEMHNGRVWESNWYPLVSTEFVGKYPSYKRRHKPTSIGIIFLKGLNSIS